MKLENKKVIVTGANRSIGRAIAKIFANEGADIIISYRSDEKGAIKTVEEVKKLGRKSKSLYVDFSRRENIKDFFLKSVDFLGSVDILVNNAAGYNTDPFLELEIEEFDYLHKVGVSAPMFLSQLTARHMIDKNIQGNIINISSISGIKPCKNRLAHACAKSALNMLTSCLALELAKYRIRVNAIAPGETPYDESNMESDTIPLGRKGFPSDQAETALYLASNQSSWVTGQIITVDGGQSL